MVVGLHHHRLTVCDGCFAREAWESRRMVAADRVTARGVWVR